MIARGHLSGKGKRRSFKLFEQTNDMVQFLSGEDSDPLSEEVKFG